MRQIVEPFAGGAIISLTALFEGLAESALLVELDPDVASVWQTVVAGDGLRLGEAICEFKVTLDRVRAVLSSTPDSTYQKAFSTILKNRVHRGGILAPGAGLVKNGENNRGLMSRWYPETLRRRLRDLHSIRHRIRIEQRDGIEAIEDLGDDSSSAFFVDPPYVVAGQRLYTFPDIDHLKLFDTVVGVRGECVVTYDDAAIVRELSRSHKLDFAVVPMKTTHHRKKVELVVGHDLSWLKD